MKELMIFEGKQVEVFEFQGKVLFNPKHVAECLGIVDVKSSIRNFNSKQKVILKNSDVHDMHFRKLNNVGENFLTESGVYKLIFKSHKEEAERFQDWVTDVVLPSIRKTGTYSAPNKDVSTALAEFRGQVATLVNDIFDQKMQDVREYYKINSRTKVDISTYIKKRLGIARVDEEYEQVKARVFLILNITKWEDLDIDSYSEIMPIVDESIRVIKLDRPQQTSLWD